MATTVANKIKTVPDNYNGTLQEYQAYTRRKLGSYSDINRGRQDLYKAQHQEMVKYVFSVFLQFK